MISSTIVWPLLASVAAARVVEPVVRAHQLSEREEAPVTPGAKAGKETGSAAAVWNHDVELLTDIQIANKTFKVVLDTGSADMWLFCTDGDDHMEAGRDAYNPVSGKRVKGTDGKDANFNIKYGKGYAKGHVYSDKMTLGGVTVNQAIGCATSVSKEDVDDRNMDGLVGLAFNSGSKNLPIGLSQKSTATKNAMNSVTTKGGGFLGFFKSDKPNAQNTWIENAFPQLQSGLFTVDIKKKEDSIYQFGYVDKARFSTPITYMPVKHWNHWVVETAAYRFGDGLTTTAVNKVLIDTGTTNIMMPPDMAKKYYSLLGSKATTTDSKNWLVPCDAGASMPDLTFTFQPPASTNTNLPAGSGGTNNKPYNAVIPGSFLIGNLSGKNDGKCQASITASEKSKNWDLILGDAFLMSQLVIFDMGGANGYSGNDWPERGQIGFAVKPDLNNGSKGTTTTSSSQTVQVSGTVPAP